MAKGKPQRREKIEKVMDEFKAGSLNSGAPTGPRVTSRDQAVAIALSEQRRADAGGGKRRGR